MKKVSLVVMFCYMFTVGWGTVLLADDPYDEIDVMFAYTKGAKEKAGGIDNVMSVINQSVELINQSFINSNIDLRVKLIPYFKEFDYAPDYNGVDDSDIFYSTYSDFMGTNDGNMDEIHTLRDKYSADVVFLIVANKAFGGLAAGNPSYSSYGFILFKIASYQSSVHELGHILGVNHEDTEGYYSYAMGYSNDIGEFRTIMGNYSATQKRNLINYWSSPDIYYNGYPVGDSTHDARRAILNTAPLISNFRKRPVTTAPILTTNLPSETFDSSVIIEVNGEAGYEVYVNGVNKGTLDSNGKKELTLNLTSVHNNFSITLKHEPSGTVSNVLNISIIKKMDTDNDGIYDHIEEDLGLNPNSIDSDGDGYTDLEELGDINNPKDTDGDGTIDALDLDSNNDGISDKDERLSSIVLITIIVPYILNNI